MVWRPFYTAGPRAQASACSMGPPASAQLRLMLRSSSVPPTATCNLRAPSVLPMSVVTLLGIISHLSEWRRLHLNPMSQALYRISDYLPQNRSLALRLIGGGQLQGANKYS